MTQPVRTASVFLTLLVSLVGCSPGPSPAVVPLRTLPPDTVGGACLGGGFGTTRVLLDPEAAPDHQVFVESEILGRKIPIWPYGWTARLDPDLRIYDRSGSVVITERETFESGGSNREDGTVWMCEVNGHSVL